MSLSDDNRLLEENTALKAQVGGLEKRVKELEALLEQALRGGKRQAAPFSRGSKKANPKKPGRKKGHPPAHREVPAEIHQELRAEPLSHCPDCQQAVAEVRRLENIEVEIPPVKPVVTRFLFEGGWCAACQKRVYSTHPHQTSTATGVAGIHLGPRAKALACEMKHRLGIPYRKISELLGRHFGLKVCAGALVRANERLAKKAEPTVSAMQETMRKEPLLHADETGWRVAADSAWLWVLCSKMFTLYQVATHRSATVIAEMVGPDFKGRLMRDGWASYDVRLKCAMLRCLLHLKRNAQALEQKQTKGAVRSPRYFQGWLKDVFALKKEATTLVLSDYQTKAKELVEWFDWFVERPYTNAANRGFAARLKEARHHIVPLIEIPDLPAHNNQAEQQIRPAVLIRKISAGNRTWRGARVFAPLASLAATCRQQGKDFALLVRRILLAAPQQPVQFWLPDSEPGTPR